MDTNAKENGVPVKELQKKEYFWCPHHNNGAGMWTLHHSKHSKANNKGNDSSPWANMATFDTMDSDSDSQWCQGQVISWFWLTTLLVLPDDFGIAFFAFVHMTCFITFLILNEFGNESVWIKSFINKLFDGPPRSFVVSTYPPICLFTTTFEKQVGSSHAQASPFH